MKMSDCRLLYPWVGVKFVAVDNEGKIGEKGTVYYFENLPNGEISAICSDQSYEDYKEETSLTPKDGEKSKDSRIVRKLLNFEDLDWKVIRSFWSGLNY